MTHHLLALISTVAAFVQPLPSSLRPPNIFPRKFSPTMKVVDDLADVKFLSGVSLKRLANAFEAADIEESGELGLKEFTSAVRASGARLSDAAIASMFEAADIDNSSTVTIDEFLAPRAVRELLCELPKSPKSVTQPFQPSALYLWRQWKGTIIETTWRPALASVLAGVTLSPAVRCFAAPTWAPFTAPDARHPLIAKLIPLAGVWDKILTLTTFVVTFFVGQSLSFWRTTVGFVRARPGSNLGL